jgi:hypothetical protein
MTTRAIHRKRGIADSISRCVDEAIVVTSHRGEPPRLTFDIDHDRVDREVAMVVVTREGSAAMATALCAGTASGRTASGSPSSGIPRC